MRRQFAESFDLRVRGKFFRGFGALGPVVKSVHFRAVIYCGIVITLRKLIHFQGGFQHFVSDGVDFDGFARGRAVEAGNRGLLFSYRQRRIYLRKQFFRALYKAHEFIFRGFGVGEIVRDNDCCVSRHNAVKSFADGLVISASRALGFSHSLGSGETLRRFVIFKRDGKTFGNVRIHAVSFCTAPRQEH